MSSRTISVDYETRYCKKGKFTIQDLGVWHYCDDPRFEPYLIAVSDGTDSWAGEPRNFNWQSLEGATLVSHNQSFDQCVYEAMVRKGMAPRVAIKGWHCTADMASFICNRRSLKDAASFLLGVELSKDTRDYADSKGEKEIKADGRWDEMLSYGRSDATHCHALFARYGHLWPDKEKRLSEMTIRQGARGIQINTELLSQYIGVAQQMLTETEATLPWIQEGKAPTSPKALAEKCRSVGIECAPIKSHFDDGEARFVAWEEKYGPKYPWIAAVSCWRSINKFLESLNTISERLMPGGLFSFSLKYFGAHTGRWSGDAGFNMQNLRKVPIFRDERGLMIGDERRLKEIEQSKTLPDFVTASLDIRKLFIPRPGRKMLAGDLSQIEPRILSYLVQDKVMLESMARGESPYVAHGRSTLGWQGGDMKHEDKNLYALCKARCLGLGYGAGWEKFIIIAQSLAGIDLTKNDPEFIEATNEKGEVCLDKEGKPILISGRGYNSKKVVKAYRDSNPLVTNLWKRLDTDFKNSVGGCYEMELPSGRSLRYTDVRRECRTVKDPETGEHKRRWITTAMIGTRRFSLYGGLLCENIVQAVARDAFAETVIVLQDTSGIDVLFTVHDEAVVEVDEGVTAKDIERIMSHSPTWAPGLPVAAEVIETPHYTK